MFDLYTTASEKSTAVWLRYRNPLRGDEGNCRPPVSVIEPIMSQGIGEELDKDVGLWLSKSMVAGMGSMCNIVYRGISLIFRKHCET